MKRFVALILFFVLGSAQAALVDRGGGFIYDDVLDVTWLQDANYAKTSGYNYDGRMGWFEAMNWADGLSVYDSVRDVTYDDWRLPTTLDPDPSCYYPNPEDPGFDNGAYSNCTGSEMGHLFVIDAQQSLGSGATSCYPVICGTNLITNLTLGYWYWSSTEFAADTHLDKQSGCSSEPYTCAWLWDLAYERQWVRPKYFNAFSSVLLLRDGDVAASVVPVPAAVWLFGSALAGLMGFRRVRR